MSDKPEIYEPQNDQLSKTKHFEKNHSTAYEVAELKRKQANKLNKHNKIQQPEKTSDYGDALSKKIGDTPEEKKEVWRNKQLENIQIKPKEIVELKRKHASELNKHNKTQQPEETSDYGDTLSKKIGDTPGEKKEVWHNKQLENTQLKSKEIAGLKRNRIEELSVHKKPESYYIDSYDKKLESIYTEYMDEVKHSNLKHIETAEKFVDANNIYVPSEAFKTRNPDDPQFWNHHSNTEKDYKKFAKEYTNLKSKVEQGATLEELQKGEGHKGAANFWFGERPIELVKYKGSYFLDGNGNHRVWLGKIHNLGDLPTHVEKTEEIKT